jgi:hypothetical protein
MQQLTANAGVHAWPAAEYFDDGSIRAQQRMQELEFVDRANWFELYSRRTDGSLWRLDVADRYKQRYLVRIDARSGWETFDASTQEMALLLAHRGGLGTACCLQQDCPCTTVKGSAFCLPHTYERGVRK